MLFPQTRRFAICVAAASAFVGTAHAQLVPKVLQDASPVRIPDLNDAEKARKQADEARRRVEATARKQAKKAEKGLTSEGTKIGNAGKKQQEKAKKTAHAALKQVGNTIVEVHKSVGNASGATRVEDQLKKDGREVGKFAGNVVREFGIGARNVERESRKAGNDVATNLKKSATDTERTVRQTGGDVGRELKGLQREVGSAGTAVYRFAVREAEGSLNTVRGAEKRIREGKVVDALWGMAVEPAQNTSTHAAQAASDSALVAMVMQTAASFYGGPAGAAAYAAWLTYNQTGGDLNAAMRVAVISALKSYVSKAAGDNPAAATVKESFKQAVVAGAVNGLAVAANGGSPADMQKALIATAGSVLVQDGYQALAKTPGVAEFAKTVKQVYCVKAIAERQQDKSCPTLNDYVKDAAGRYAMLTPEGAVKYIDKNTAIPAGDWVFLTKEQAMKKAADEAGLNIDLSKLPRKDVESARKTVEKVIRVRQDVDKVKNANILSLFDDRWAISYTAGREVSKLKASVAPAVLLTYTGISKSAQGQAQAARAAFSKPQEMVSCQLKGQVYQIGVVANRESRDVKCAVLERVGDAEPKWQWYAKNDLGYCQSRMLETATKKIAAGFTCSGR